MNTLRKEDLIVKHFSLKSVTQSRLGYMGILLVVTWITNLYAYFTTFNLGVESPFQYFILAINPLATSLLLLSIGLYAKKGRTAYILMTVIALLMNTLLFSNVVYYREFTSFITVNSILSVGSVASGLESDIFKLIHPSDIIYWVSYIIIGILFATKVIKVDQKPMKTRVAFAMTSVAVLLFGVNLTLAEIDRPELLTRTFSHDYMVKYLGINAFTAYDGIQTYQVDQRRAKADSNDLKKVETYVNEHYAAPNKKYYGMAKGRNVIIVHLESLQQFVIDYKYKDKDGKEYEVTPFLNQLFHDKQTFAFDNFFHQVGSGKTSDAETLMENSLFGLNQGPIMVQLGGKNTFQAAPTILNQTAGYDSAVFHGNAGSFWNRNEAYKHFGYNYFFDSSYFNLNKNNSFQYGLHDKYMLGESVKYLEHMQQPFYVKFLNVSNHYPFEPFKGKESGFPIADTGDETVNGYFATANYLDQSVKQLFDYLKKSGLYDNSMIVLYGDHYGISNTRAKNALSPLLGKSKETWTDFDDAKMQRVPYMIHIPGQDKGFVNHTYGGQVDNLPTLLHLLGIDTKKYIELGQDLFSKEHSQVVAFRNGNFVTPQFTVLEGVSYNTKTGQKIEKPTKAQQTQIDKDTKAVETQLSISDDINNGDLLRFANTGIQPIDPTTFDYKNQMERLLKNEKQLGNKSTSLYHDNNNKTTQNMYKSYSYQDLHSNQ